MPEPSTTDADQCVLVPCSTLNRRFRYTWKDDGQIVETEAIVATHDTWTSRPESRSPLWLARLLGGLVLAIRLPDRT